jgi:hypothetical protein
MNIDKERVFLMLRYLLAVLVVVVWGNHARPQTEPEKRQTIAYLNKLQTKTGGFMASLSPDEAKRVPSLRATSAALRAYRYFEGEVPHKDKVVEFVKSCYIKETGAFADQPGKGNADVFSTASGLMAVVELKIPQTDYLEAIDFFDKNVKIFDELRIAVAGLESIGKQLPRSERLKMLIGDINNTLEVVREKEGAKPLVRMTGSMIVTLLRLGEKIPEQATMTKILLDGQMRDGGFAKENVEKSDLESTYRVERALMMLKTAPKDVEAMRSFVAKCRNEDGGYGVQPGAPSSVSATYFASIVLHWLKKM